MSGTGAETDNRRKTCGRSPAEELRWLTIGEISDHLRQKKISPVELTQLCLDQTERLNQKLNAVITMTAESALTEARRAEREIQNGNWRGPLHGVPIALKDLFDTAGVPTTAASALFRDRVAANDGEVVRRLKAAGAVLLGKLNLHEFGYGGSSVISHFGPVRNPWSPDYIAGGSSAGSAVAVAAGLCYGALGTDTGGSVRQPSAYCGTVGLKPTYGRVSTRGVIPLSWSLDHVGPITRSVADVAIMLQVIAGYDPWDSTSVDAPVPDYRAALNDRRPLRVGVPRAHFYDKLDAEVQSAMTAALSVIGKIASSLQDVQMPASHDTTVLRAEAYAYHSDEIRSSPDLYQPETLRRIRSGEQVPMAAYIQARRQMDEYRRRISKAFEAVDLFITPTTPVPPVTIAELLRDADELRAKEILMLRNTRPFNILGLPTISVPCGFTRTGLPIGMQITGAPWAEATVLRLAQDYEKQTHWHTRRPHVAT